MRYKKHPSEPGAARVSAGLVYPGKDHTNGSRLCTVLALSLLPLSALAEDAAVRADGPDSVSLSASESDGSIGTVQWWIRGDTLYVRGAGATPNLYGRDSDAWMPYLEGIRRLVVENGITALGYGSFLRFPALETVILPDSLKEIAASAFYECPKLDRVSLPEGLRSLHDSVFSGCAGLHTVYIPATVEAIGSRCFLRTGLTDLWYGGTTAQWAKLNKGEVAGTKVSLDGVRNVTFHPSAQGLKASPTYSVRVLPMVYAYGRRLDHR